MNIIQPIWYLNKNCPVCGQGSSLVPIKCPQCNHVLVQCDEELTIFKDYRSINLNNIHTNPNCPQCPIIKIEQFIALNDEEIQQLGFNTGDYHSN